MINMGEQAPVGTLAVLVTLYTRFMSDKAERFEVSVELRREVGKVAMDMFAHLMQILLNRDRVGENS